MKSQNSKTNTSVISVLSVVKNTKPKPLAEYAG